jgi:integrase
MNHLKLTNVDSLLENQLQPKIIESQLIDYVRYLRNGGVAFATIQFLIAPIFTFYQLNDVILNRRKVQRYLGEYRRMVRDRVYTTEQIQQALATADHRMRMIILILASTGCRIGSLPSLTLRNLTKLPDYGLYKITFYERTNNEYYSFTTRECAQTGIDTYLSYRQRCGEKLSFNQKTNRWEPEDTPLIRQSFDMNDSLQAARQVKPISLHGLRMALDIHLTSCGIRQPEHPTEHNKRVRKSIALANGFRKHVISTFIEAGLNHEIRELLAVQPRTRS